MSVPIPITLSDLERRDARSHIFRRISSITLAPFERPKFGRITRVERGVFLGGQPRLYHKGRGPSARQFWRFLSIDVYTLCPRTTWTYQIWRGNWGGAVVINCKEKKWGTLSSPFPTSSHPIQILPLPPVQVGFVVKLLLETWWRYVISWFCVPYIIILSRCNCFTATVVITSFLLHNVNIRCHLCD